MWTLTVAELGRPECEYDGEKVVEEHHARRGRVGGRLEQVGDELNDGQRVDVELVDEPRLGAYQRVVGERQIAHGRENGLLEKRVAFLPLLCIIIIIIISSFSYIP